MRMSEARFVPSLRIFLASPGDVSDERGLALSVIERLEYDPFLRGKVALEAVAWDQPGGGATVLATTTPQASIGAGLSRPSECDIVAVMFWAKMGTPLPHPQYAKPDGSPYASGTEWEFEDAVRAARENGRPAVLLYRRSTKRPLDPNDADFDEQLRQWYLVEEFFARLTDPESGSIRGGYKPYDSPTDFRDAFEHDLKTLIEERLRASTPENTTSAPAPVAPLWQGSPFPGLRAFTPEDAPIFFGRGRETDALVARVAATRFVAVVGASGSGKSSLVGAGLIPRLAGGAVADVADWLAPTFDNATSQWQGLRFTPGELGNDPFLPLAVRLAPLLGAVVRELASSFAQTPEAATSAIAQALHDKRPGAQALVVVDQFEELFTLVDAVHVEPFVALLENLSRAENTHTVVTMRSDFYHRCLELPPLARLLEDGQFPLSTPEATLFEMITRPAERAGLQFEEGLADQIVIDTGREAGALPLLAYTLDELDRRRDGELLSFAAYADLGRVQGAIGKRAESVFARLDEATQATFSIVFRELVEIDERGQVARRRARLDQVAVDEHAHSLIDTFTEARLLVQSAEREREPIVYVAHEALFGSWDRLRDWLQLHQDDLRQMQKVEAAAEEWLAHGRADSYLWPHERLEPVYDALTRLKKTLDPETQLFIRPEYERLFESLNDAATTSHRRQFIVDRLVAIGEPTIPGLLEAMRSSDTQTREVAASGLARLGARSVPGLIDALQAAAPEVRLAAVATLREIGDERAVPHLIAALRDEDGRVRSLAAGALEALPTSEGAEAIAEALADPEVDVRWRAAGMLGAFGAAAVLPLLPSLDDDDARVADAARSALAAIGESGVEELLPVLHAPTAADRARAAEALTIVGRAAVPGSLELLGDDDADVRWRVVEVLGAIGDPAGVEGLVSALRDDDAAVRRSAAGALGLIADASAVSALAEALSDDDPNVAEAAAIALSTIGAPSVDPLLAHLRGSTNGFEQALSATALGEIGQPAVAGLIAALEDEDTSVRRRAVGGLERCGAAALPSLLGALRAEQADVRDAAVTILRAIGEAAVPELVELAHDPNPVVRRAVAAALAGTPARRSERALVELLTDEDAGTREAAANGLAALGERALPTLFDALESDDSGISGAATRALAATGGAAVPGLLRLAAQRDGTVRRTTVDLLTQIGTPAALFGVSELGLDADGA
jgi:HEAT repeat protein